MTQWTGQKAIVKKYQISPEELLHILDKGEVAYSDVNGVLMVDEESFVAYINALRQVERQNNAVHRLKRTLRAGKKMKLDKADRTLARRLEGRVTSIYSVVTHTLSMLLEPQERKIFLAVADGESIGSVAWKMGMKSKEAFQLFNDSVEKLDTHAPYIIRRVVERSREVEEVNRGLVQKLAGCDKRISHLEDEKQQLVERMGYAQRLNDILKIHIDCMQSMFDTERKVNAELEKMLEAHYHSADTEHFSFIKSCLHRLFHTKTV